jgi:hypothetical protein
MAAVLVAMAQPTAQVGVVVVVAAVVTQVLAMAEQEFQGKGLLVEMLYQILDREEEAEELEELEQPLLPLLVAMVELVHHPQYLELQHFMLAVVVVGLAIQALAAQVVAVLVGMVQVQVHLQLLEL